jgi:hypothetical protein
MRRPTSTREQTMAFIQIIDFHTSRMDEGQAVVDEYLAKTEGRRTAGRGILCQDRDDPTRYLNIVFFESYESAMENSNMPETGELSQKLMALTDGPAAFLNLDVISDRD